MNLSEKLREWLTPAFVAEFRATLARIEKKENLIMIDTRKILDAVEKEITENAGLRTLIAELKTANKKLAADLADAIAANDPVAMGQVQTDMDAAADKLSLDDADTAAALAANVAPADAGTVNQPKPDAP